MTERPTNDRGARGAPPTTAPPTDLHRTPTPPEGPSVVLSPRWIAERGLPRSGPINAEKLPDGSLVLRPALDAAPAGSYTAAASPDRPGEHLFRELVAAYLGGATEFVVVAPDGVRAETHEIVRAFAERTGGPTIVSQDEQVLVLRDAPPAPAVPLPELLRRMYRAVREIQETAGSLLDSTAIGDASTLAARDDDVDRHAWRVERSLLLQPEANRSEAHAGTTRSDTIASILIARALERTADHAVVLGEHSARLSECSIPASVRSSLRAYHRQALEYLDSAFAVTEAPDARRANELLDTGAALHAAHRSLTESFLVHGTASELTPLASADLGLVLQSIDRTVAYAQDLVEVGLDRAVAAQLALSDAQPASPEALRPRSHRAESRRRVAASP